MIQTGIFLLVECGQENLAIFGGFLGIYWQEKSLKESLEIFKNKLNYNYTNKNIVFNAVLCLQQQIILNYAHSVFSGEIKH